MNDLTFTHQNNIYTLQAHAAPDDVNGNKRFDIAVTMNGEPYREPVKGYRKVKQGYRTQYGAHHYNMQAMLEDLFKAIVNDKQEQEAKPVRSTQKDVTEMIREHIVVNLSDDYGETVQEQLESVAKGFIDWYSPYERRRTPNVQQAFKEWLQGIPSQLYATPYHYEQRELLNTWLGAKDTNFTDDVVAARYYHLIFREFNKLCTLNGITSLYTRL